VIIVGEASSKEIALGLGELKPCGCAEVSGGGGKNSMMRPYDQLFPHARVLFCCRGCQYQGFCGVPLHW